MNSSKNLSQDAFARRIRRGVALLGLAVALGVAGGASAFTPSPASETAIPAERPSAAAQSLLPTPPLPVLAPILADVDMRDDGYNSEYIFGMTKGVASSTLHPAIKPVCFIVTVPLDLVFLPFAAIGGFF